jgi:hypothetical protein
MSPFVQSYLEGLVMRKLADFPGLGVTDSQVSDPFPPRAAPAAWNVASRLGKDLNNAGLWTVRHPIQTAGIIGHQTQEFKDNVSDFATEKGRNIYHNLQNYRQHPGQAWQDTKQLGKDMTYQPALDVKNDLADGYQDFRAGGIKSLGPTAIKTTLDGLNLATNVGMLTATGASDGAASALIPEGQAAKGFLMNRLRKMLLPAVADVAEKTIKPIVQDAALRSVQVASASPEAATQEASSEPATPVRTGDVVPKDYLPALDIPGRSNVGMAHDAWKNPAPPESALPTAAPSVSSVPTTPSLLQRAGPWAAAGAAGLAAGGILAWTKARQDAKRKALPPRVHKYPTLFASQQVP